MTKLGEHAVVLGGSIAGLMAARVLTEFYDRVTVVERDVLGDGDGAGDGGRRGVPQAQQPHLVLARCAQIAGELFPGILEEMLAAGGHRWDDGDLSRIRATFGGHRLLGSGHIPDPASLVNYIGSRPFVEAHVRRRVRGLSTVRLLDGHEIVDLEHVDARITGVRVRSRNGGTAQPLTADLVVDASGRGSRAPAFLDELGYGRPDVDELTVRITYASMPIRITEGSVHENLIVRQLEPGRPYAFAMFQGERDTWHVTVAALGGLRLPTTLEELLEFGVGTAPETVLAAARAGRPLAGIRVHRHPSNRWRRYDKMRRLPDGFVVLGDAFCSFNPIYGQGMTVAALEALVLRDCLAQGSADLPRRFFRAAGRTVRVAWGMAVGSDLALPEIEGHRSMATRLSNTYLDRVLRAAEVDARVAQDFLRVTGMLAPPGTLGRPVFVARVIRGNLRRRVTGSMTPATAPVQPADASPSLRTHGANAS